MTEDDARNWIGGRYGAGVVDTLERFVASVRDENSRQNLISPASVEGIWVRHVMDSAQLVPLAPANGTWLDVGSGGGFPGMIAAILRRQPTMLVEPRTRRAGFLADCAVALGLAHVIVVAAKVETVSCQADVISARAVASVENLLHAASRCATQATQWLLPRGRSGDAELAQLRQRWRGVFHVEQSLTDPDSTILVLEQVSRR